LWDLAAIEAQAAAQRSWRCEPRPAGVPGAGRVAKWLRVIGAALDADAQDPYLVVLRETVVVVEGRDGYRRIFEQRPLSRRERLAPHLRGHVPT
jgi:hypothetical protein